MTMPIHQNQKGMVEHGDNIKTDTSANVSQVEMREVVDKVHVPQMPLWNLRASDFHSGRLLTRLLIECSTRIECGD